MELDFSNINLKPGFPKMENEMMINQWSNNYTDYELIEKIGEGATSEVYKANEQIHNSVCAIKIVDLAQDEDEEERVLNEIETLSLLNHENIMNIYKSFSPPTDLKIWMVLPYFQQGSLRTLLNNHYPDGMPEKIVINIVYQVLRGLEYIHNNHKMIHRDIKCANLFLKDDGTVLLGDFGVCASLIKRGEAMTSRKTFAGSLWWMAPEVMQQSKYRMSADIWSLGITAIELAKGKPPHSEFRDKPMKIVMIVMSKPSPILNSKEDKKQFSSQFRKFVEKCLIKDQYYRYSAKNLLNERPFKYLKEQKIKGEILEKININC